MKLSCCAWPFAFGQCGALAAGTAKTPTKTPAKTPAKAAPKPAMQRRKRHYANGR